jgi:uncharacterized protein (TIGR02186 family)
MAARILLWIASAIALSFGAPAALAQSVVVDLSHREVAISTGFTGEELLLFGATEGSGDIVVTVTGPRREEVVRRKERVAGIWVNGASMTFPDAPAYYRVAASRPLSEIADEKDLRRLRIGPESLALEARLPVDRGAVGEFRAAFIRNKQHLDLYGSELAPITINSGRLFRTSIPFPANVPTGEYQVAVFLFKDGRLISLETTPLRVRKVGLEAQIFSFANEHAPWYGAIAIAIALLAGWLAGVVFRRN